MDYSYDDSMISVASSSGNLKIFGKSMSYTYTNRVANFFGQVIILQLNLLLQLNNPVELVIKLQISFLSKWNSSSTSNGFY